MKTHKKKQSKKKQIKKKNNTKTKKGGFSGPLSYIKKHYARSNILKSASEKYEKSKEKAEERGDRRMKYLRGQVGDKFRSIGHTLANTENPIVTAYQLIEENVFGWGVPAKSKPAFVPKHQKVSFKQFMKSDIPELTGRAKEKTKLEEEPEKKEEPEKMSDEDKVKEAADKLKKEAAEKITKITT